MTMSIHSETILAGHFRANPAYRPLLLDRLPAGERERLRALANESDYYGILRAVEEGGGDDMLIDQDTALLYLTLQQAGPVPGYMRQKCGPDCARVLAELVLEGVLQIRAPDSHHFVSGGAAHGILFDKTEEETTGDSALARLSLQALHYARHLPLPSAQLASRLYGYNTIPYSTAWDEKLAQAESPAATLAQSRAGRLRGPADRTWIAVPRGEQAQGWAAWYAQDAANGRSGGHLPFKLYISPRPEALDDAWPSIVDGLARGGAPTFKAGDSVQMLLRPDKIVAYFGSFVDLARTADVLQEALDGCPAQGVPFTAPIDRTGLLSWGMDPRRQVASNGETLAASWRSWITQQCAAALVEARGSEMTVDPVQFALDRLRLAGVDTRSWVPKQSIWRDAGRNGSHDQ